jgi:hypothetical protein
LATGIWCGDGFWPFSEFSEDLIRASLSCRSLAATLIDGFFG